VTHRSFGSIGIELLNSQGQIVKRLDAELGAILAASLWFCRRDRNQKACAVPVLELVTDRHAAAPVDQANDTECPTEQWMCRIAHHYFDDG
jgi:hypothetical protein